MDIRILPSNIANMIAAGEVVQRPSSVVKELLENAVDAGATNIQLIISDAGRTLIQVIDNGKGMTPDEAVLCFERHATSKISSAEDLHNIMTFGFRGEALASIASVSQVELKTRVESEELGVQVVFADSQHKSTEMILCPVGCNFAVRNLFYNVPARRKFLKSDNVEFKHIVEEFTRVALTRVDIKFSLLHNDKEIFSTRLAPTLKFRINELFNKTIVDELVEIQNHTSTVAIDGFIGRPDLARKSLGNQFFFVNGRFCKSPYLHKAIMKAYENMIPAGTTPSYFIYLNVDPNSIDINIHPTKTEIKFEDDSVLFHILHASVKAALAKNSFGVNIDFEDNEEYRIPVITPSQAASSSHRLDISDFEPNTDYNPFDNMSYEQVDEDLPQIKETRASYSSTYPSYKREDYSALFKDEIVKERTIVLLNSKYIAYTDEQGLIFVNIKRARESLIYDRLYESLSKNEIVSNISLFPVTIQLGVDNILLLKEYLPLLQSMGFSIDLIGEDSVMFKSVPDTFSADEEALKDAIFHILQALDEGANDLDKDFYAKLVDRLSSVAAQHSEKLTTVSEAKDLIDKLMQSSNKEFTHSGHRICSVLSLNELEKRF